VRGVARDLAGVLAARDAKRLTTEARKNKRQGRLYLDVMRNAYAQTAVPPYAVRARPGAPVATPLDWSEVEDRTLAPSRFTITTIGRRIDRDPDPWKGMARRGRSLAKARARLSELVDNTAPRSRGHAAR
jgi:bifunctional non-homologous end joining protein LigD